MPRSEQESVIRAFRCEVDFQKAVSAGVTNLKNQCCNCSLIFSKENVWTPEGWANTQLTGLCESCYEDIVDNMIGEDS